jgi:hypothetical protein
MIAGEKAHGKEAPGFGGKQIPRSADDEMGDEGQATIIHQMLGTYIVLISKLIYGRLQDQTSFDMLCKLIIIFCKIIKQGSGKDVATLRGALEGMLASGSASVLPCLHHDIFSR